MPAPNQAFRGASLYSGIFDTQEQSTDPQQEDIVPQDSTGTTHQTRVSYSSDQIKTVGSSANDAAASSKSSGWSAALRFAPRRTAAAAKAKPRPNAAFVASFAPAAPKDPAIEELASEETLGRAPSVALTASASTAPASSSETITEVPATATEERRNIATESISGKSLASVDTSDLKLTALALPHADKDDEWLLSQLERYPVTQPPPFTLPSEVIERDKALARRSAAARGDTRHQSNHDGVEAEDEEPADVNGFLSTAAGKLAARKRKKRKRGSSPPSGPSMNGEYDPRIPNDYMAYKHSVYDRRRAELEFRKWQDDQEERGYGVEDDEGYNEAEQVWRENDDMSDSRLVPSLSPTAPLQGQRDETFAKTVVPAQALTGEEAYARRVALSATASTNMTAAVGAATAVPPSSGEDEYQRRVAMTKAATGEEAYLRRLAMSQASPPKPETAPGPPPGPPPARPPQSSQLAASSPPDPLSARQAAAAAIAARLNTLHPKPPSPPPASQPPSDPNTFAERLMASYGYVRGTGLGASSDGILQPLVATSTSSNRGKITNPAQSTLAQIDAAKYGSCTASPIIVLLNIATPQSLSSPTTTQELIDEIKSECAKFGIVQQVLPHLCTTTPEQEVRVFVQFTGEAGSWKAVRGLHARWFEGRQVIAGYYDQAAFARGELDLLLPFAQR